MIFPITKAFNIKLAHGKIKKETKIEWQELQSAIKEGDKEKIIKAAIQWNQSLLKFHRQH